MNLKEMSMFTIDVIPTGIFITIWWLLSYSILLPFTLLLTFNRTASHWWFSLIYTLMLKLCQITYQPRKKTFEILEKELSKRKTSTPLDVLEIGVAHGPNLEFYPKIINLTSLDVNKTFETYFVKNKKKHPHINYVQTIIGTAEHMSQIENNSFDLVIETYVLCSVTNVKATLSEVKRVLKPGGKFLFLDHVAYPRNNKKRIFQIYAKHLWKTYCAGCNIDRFIKDAIVKTGFKKVYCKEDFQYNFPLLIQPHIMGIATK